MSAGRGVCTLPALVADEKGGAFVFWGQWDAPRTTVRVSGQHVDASGRALWDADGRALSSGSFVSMDQAAPADGGGVWAFYAPAIAATSDGAHGAILGWAASTGGGLDVFVTRVGPDGALRWNGERSLCSAPGDQTAVACTPAGAEGVAFAWRDARAGSDVSLRAQLVSSRGRSRWTRDGGLVADGPGDRGPFALTSDGGDAFYFAWADPRSGGQLFAQRLLRNGRRAPGWERSGALVSARASGDPNTETPFIRLVRSSRGSAIATWSDAAIGTLAMRLDPRGPALEPAGTVPLVTEARPSAPPPPVAFGLLGVSPHPVVGAAFVRLALPTSASATLELFDVTGRRVWSRELGGSGAGEHVLPLAAGSRLPAGIYMLRLAQGPRVATRRVVVL